MHLFFLFFWETIVPNTDEWKCDDTIVSGLWKFSSIVTLEQLQEVVAEWRRAGQHDMWEEFYIRGVDRNGALGIGFRYRLCSAVDGMLLTPKKLDQMKSMFFHRITDQLKRRFGNDLVGWDISRSIWVLVEANN